METQVLIADDHALFRAGVREIACNIVPDATVLESDSYQTALERIQESSNLQLVLVDLCMPGMHGFTSLRNLLESAVDVPVAVISASNNPDDIRACFDCGVMGYIPKTEAPTVMIKALQLILAGGVYVPALVLNSESRARANTHHPEEKLTTKQSHVLECMIKGSSNKEIARELHMSEATVKAHITGIFKSLNVNNRTQAVSYANQWRTTTHAHVAIHQAVIN